MGSRSDNPPLIKYIYKIGVNYCGESMRNDNKSAAFYLSQ